MPVIRMPNLHRGMPYPPGVLLRWHVLLFTKTGI